MIKNCIILIILRGIIQNDNKNKLNTHKGERR